MVDETQENTGRINIDDTIAALDSLGVAAKDTNASAVREKLGRGSFQTIQKHLDTLRTQQSVQAAPDAPVEIPKEILQHLWNSAIADARAHLALRVEKLTAEHAQATETATQATADRDAAYTTAEKWEGRYITAQAEAALASTAVADLKRQIETLQTDHKRQIEIMVATFSETAIREAIALHTPPVVPIVEQKPKKTTRGTGNIGGTGSKD